MKLLVTNLISGNVAKYQQRHVVTHLVLGEDVAIGFVWTSGCFYITGKYNIVLHPQIQYMQFEANGITTNLVLTAFQR